MSHDDDLAAWDDDPLVQALRAPATPVELAGEAGALAAFRSAVPRRSRRRLARRLGTGTGTLAIAVALSGGVAAAYTHTLPEPVQSVAHGLLGVVGVPAPDAAAHSRPARGARPHWTHAAHHHPTTTVRATVVQTVAPPSARPTSTATASASAVVRRPAPSHSTMVVAADHRSARPSASPPPSASPSPSASSPSPTPLTPAALQGTASAQRVPAGSGVTLSGHLTASSGAPVPDQPVLAQARPAGQHQAWTQVGSGSTDSKGDVAIGVPALSRTTRLRLVAAKGVNSAPVTVVVVPALSASLARAGNRYAVTVTSSGLQPGDVLVVTRRVRGHPTVVHRVATDTSGTASFFVAVPARRDVTFRVRVARSVSHAAALTTFVAIAA